MTKLKIILIAFLLLFLFSLPARADWKSECIDHCNEHDPTPECYAYCENPNDIPDGPIQIESTAKYIKLNVPIGGITHIAMGGRGFAFYIQLWYSFIIGAVGILATVMIMYAGIKWLTSRGNAGVISDAKEKIWSAIIGLVIAFLSYSILALINPGLLTIGLPDLDTVNVNLIKAEEPQMQDMDTRQSGSTPINNTSQAENTNQLNSDRINVANGVRVDGVDQQTMDVATALQNDFGRDLTITSGYRPGSTGSQHALGRALDFRRSEDFDNFMRQEVIGNTPPAFYYHGQPGYHVNYNGMMLVIIDEPVNNCWHIDTRFMN